ncbi:hypothetical protein B0T11DRAFT_294534 [Plectosphaerella cucumerina]|uniref:Uncharacterized protein n=1 Tax=Plectosphaerella cucumerina TaxID=40658 RepID=A0A8K0TWJ9_9PEZI|nr:hypothetical protein B0T11DRAFT_294534 [Plectosphaerella cucumerina]
MTKHLVGAASGGLVLTGKRSTSASPHAGRAAITGLELAAGAPEYHNMDCTCWSHLIDTAGSCLKTGHNCRNSAATGCGTTQLQPPAGSWLLDCRPATPSDLPDLRASSHTPEPAFFNQSLALPSTEDRLLRIEIAVASLSIHLKSQVTEVLCAVQLAYMGSFKTTDVAEPLDMAPDTSSQVQLVRMHLRKNERYDDVYISAARWVGTSAENALANSLVAVSMVVAILGALRGHLGIVVLVGSMAVSDLLAVAGPFGAA